VSVSNTAPGLALLPRGQVPEEGIDTMAEMLRLPERVALSLTHRAEDPLLDTVYKAQAEVRRLKKNGAGAQEIETAKVSVRAAVALTQKRLALVQDADRCTSKWNAGDTTDYYLTALFSSRLGRFEQAEQILAWAVSVHHKATDRLALAQAQLGARNHEAAEATALEMLLERSMGQDNSLRANDLIVESCLVRGDVDAAARADQLIANGAHSKNWGVRAAMLAMQARHADHWETAQILIQLTATALQKAGSQGQYDSIGKFHALVGNAGDTLTFVKEGSWSDMFLQPAYANVFASADADTRTEWNDHLRAHFRAPEQLATIRFELVPPLAISAGP
jgi:hypothetical protein